MLDAIQERLGTMVRPTWASDVTAWGQLVRLYRLYVEGDHRAKMTHAMREMLRISDARTEQLNINYCDLVVQKMGDRLTVTGISGDSPAASQWAADVLAYNRFDGVQMDVHDAAIRDGVTYVLVSYDNDAQQPVFAHELAWDGDCGMIVVWDRMCKTIIAAVKVWWEGTGRRVNLYFPDRVEKYVYDDGTGSGTSAGGTGATLKPLVGADGNVVTADWSDLETRPVGVPVVAFRNRAKTWNTTGQSEIASIVPLQDGLNRTFVSMLMTGELTAFQIRIALGFSPPAKTTPGMWVVIGEEGLTKDQQADAKVLEQGQIVPFINQAQFTIDQIGTVSQTPLPSQMGGDTQSGEALKQRESGLIGKVQRAQVKLGNSWEDTMTLAAVVQQAFGTIKPKAAKRWTTQWRDAQVRNDGDVIDNALKVADRVGDEEFLHLIAQVYGYDADKIKALLEAKDQRTGEALDRAMRSLPNFANGQDMRFGAN